ncbi:hypothetical protein LPJ59_002444 [Coemansia sp. RSA 2399]|nr:hypothetical protein LPJ59_002444 [Coemansia sp. RSA 2399]
MLIRWTYCDLALRYTDIKWLSDRAILAPTNNMVDSINERMLHLMNIDTVLGSNRFPTFESQSADKLANPDINCNFIQNISAAGATNTATTAVPDANGNPRTTADTIITDPSIEILNMI